MGVGLAEADAARPVEGKAIGAGRDRGEGDGLEPVGLGECQAVAIARGERLVLALVAAVPDRADGVDDVAGGEVVAAGDARLAGGAAAKGPALGYQLGAGGAVNGAVDAGPAKERGLGRVDDGSADLRGDVAFDNLDGAPVVDAAPSSSA